MSVLPVLRSLVLGSALMLGVPCSGAFDAFLQITPLQSPELPGAAQDPLYKGWIEILSFGTGLGNTVTFSPSLMTGRPVIDEFVLTKTVDQATPVAFSHLAAGTVLASVRLVLVERGPLRVELWELTATTAAFTHQNIDGGGEGQPPVENLAIKFGTMEWTYTQINAAGEPVSEHFATWDAIRARGNSGTRAPSWRGGTDTDGDGLPDAWELHFGFDPEIADADSDRDADGVPARLEYIARTDPNSAQSVFRVTSLEANSGTTMVLKWQSVPGRTYRVTRATNPGGPYSLHSSVSAESASSQTVVPLNGGAIFYRVETP